MRGVVQQIGFLFLASSWYLEIISNSDLIPLIPSASLFQTASYLYLAWAQASYCGITCPQRHNGLVKAPWVGQGLSLFWLFPVREAICLHCGYDTLSLLRNWNKQNHENYWKKKLWGVFLASVFSNPRSLTCICPTFSADILKGIKMRALALTES